jgi:hypothetical protein
MAKTNIKAIIRQCLNEVLLEELDIPSQDGSPTGADPDDQQKAKDATKDGDSVKFVKPGELEEGEEITTEETHAKLSELIETIHAMLAEVNELEEYAKTSKDKKMGNLLGKLGKGLSECTGIFGQLKEIKEGILSEEKEKASHFGDKVVKCLGKHLKTEEQGTALKAKYMAYIEAAYKKGKKPQDVADRIKDHRFEM